MIGIANITTTYIAYVDVAMYIVTPLEMKEAVAHWSGKSVKHAKLIIGQLAA